MCAGSKFITTISPEWRVLPSTIESYICEVGGFIFLSLIFFVFWGLFLKGDSSRVSRVTIGFGGGSKRGDPNDGVGGRYPKMG